MEAGLGLYFLSVGDDGPSPDVGKERVDGLFVVADVFLSPLLDVLRVNNLFGGGNYADVEGLL